MPGPQSKSNPGPRNDTPLIPSWMDNDDCAGGCRGTGYVWRDVYVIDGWSVSGDWCPVCRPAGKLR
jgi:hypothetical protein